MTIKEDMKPKKEDKAVEESKHPFTQDYEDKKTKEKPKKKDQEYELLKLQKCIKEKDKRIKKIEDYFWLRNRLILSVLLSLLCILPWALLIIYVERPPADFVFSIIGMMASVVGTFIIWMFGLGKIWGNKP